MLAAICSSSHALALGIGIVGLAGALPATLANRLLAYQ